eukprot:463798-Amphidinium_carterae.1
MAPSANPLDNPLRQVIVRYSCAACGKFDPVDGKGTGNNCANRFLCGRCLELGGQNSQVRAEENRYAYVSVLYGQRWDFLRGALALGQSLRERHQHEQILLHT